MKTKKQIPQTDALDVLRFSLSEVFGDEWTALSRLDQSLIVRDCLEDGGVSDLAEYRRNIGTGNLASYVKVMRVRFAKDGK